MYYDEEGHEEYHTLVRGPQKRKCGWLARNAYLETFYQGLSFIIRFYFEKQCSGVVS